MTSSWGEVAEAQTLGFMDLGFYRLGIWKIRLSGVGISSSVSTPSGTEGIESKDVAFRVLGGHKDFGI